MTTYKKTIVLNNSTVKNYNGSAILTLTKTNDNSVYGTLKCFNISNKPNLILGIAQNKKEVFKQNVNLFNNNTYNFKISNLDLNLPTSSVLMEDEPTKVIPLIWGSDSKQELKDEIIENLAILKNQVNIKEKHEPERKLDLNEMFDISNDEVEQLINLGLTQDVFNASNSELENLNQNSNFENLNTPNYAEDFTLFKQKNEGISKVLSNKNIIEEEMENLELSDNETFYEAMSDQIEDLFNKYPAETNLEQLIPNSKWVKIDYENDGNFYVLGLIYEDITLKYICYGVPGTYSTTAPNGLDSYSQWLPTNINAPTENGYWVMYQDAISGESVLIDAM